MTQTEIRSVVWVRGGVPKGPGSCGPPLGGEITLEFEGNPRVCSAVNKRAASRSRIVGGGFFHPRCT